MSASATADAVTPGASLRAASDRAEAAGRRAWRAYEQARDEIHSLSVQSRVNRAQLGDELRALASGSRAQLQQALADAVPALCSKAPSRQEITRPLLEMADAVARANALHTAAAALPDDLFCPIDAATAASRIAAAEPHRDQVQAAAVEAKSAAHLATTAATFRPEEAPPSSLTIGGLSIAQPQESSKACAAREARNAAGFRAAITSAEHHADAADAAANRAEQELARARAALAGGR